MRRDSRRELNAEAPAGAFFLRDLRAKNACIDSRSHRTQHAGVRGAVRANGQS